LAEFTEEQLKYLIWRVNGLLEQYRGQRVYRGPVRGQGSDTGTNQSGTAKASSSIEERDGPYPSDDGTD